LNEVRILVLGGTIEQNVIFRLIVEMFEVDHSRFR